MVISANLISVFLLFFVYRKIFRAKLALRLWLTFSGCNSKCALVQNRTTPRHIIIKTTSSETRERILKAVREKKPITY
jgi:hypothetical protein